MSARAIIFDYFSYSDKTLTSLMDFLDTDTLVDWFVSEQYADELDGEDYETIMKHYEMHCI